MKQHERTHKDLESDDKSNDSTARRSKAAITKDAQKAKQTKKTDAMKAGHSRRSSMMRSPLSDVTSLAPPTTETSVNSEESIVPGFYPDSQQMLLPIQPIPEVLSPNVLYPPMGDDLLAAQASLLPLPQLMMDKSSVFGLNPHMGMTPGLRFPDLDTLAQAAESFDPYYAPPNM